MLNKVLTVHELAIPVSIVNFVSRVPLGGIEFPRCHRIEMQFFCQINDFDLKGVRYWKL